MTCWQIAACALAATALFAQDPATPATLQGAVRDSKGKPVAAAIVKLRSGGRTLTASTNASGIYKFEAMPAGTYTGSVEVPDQGEAASGPFTLAPGETKNLDLTLAAKPEFFDQPTFIVAGVTDGATHGGHGSDAILRSSEDLAKATATLGDLEEKRGDALEAARQYERAARLDPSEPNLFNWAAELLAHRAIAPAIEVFTKGNRLFPRSTRMLLGLAVSQYANGAYDQAAQRFFEATDLNPSDPSPYLFLAKVESSTIAESEGFHQRMRRFATLQPDNARANYYYARSLWNQQKLRQVQPLLEKAIRLDPKFADAYLQLGIVEADQKHFAAAIAAYQQAIKLNPRFEEAHYRLAQAYAATGDKPKAQQEFALHQKLVQESSADVERARRELQQFVIELRR